MCLKFKTNGFFADGSGSFAFVQVFGRRNSETIHGRSPTSINEYAA
jgi:hypothetical protein